MIILISAVIITVFYLQGLPLLRGRKWRELTAFLLLLFLAGFFMYAHVLELYLPNPVDYINYATQIIKGN